MKFKLPKIKKLKISLLKKKIGSLIIIILVLGYKLYSHTLWLQQKATSLESEKQSHLTQLEEISNNLEEMQNRDEYKINQEQKEEIANIQVTYQKAVVLFLLLLS